MKKFLCIIIFILAFVNQASASSKIYLAELNGTVSAQMEDFVQQAISKSEQDEADLIIFQLDTPGGLVEAMRGIVLSIVNSRVPVIVFVSGRAASAGAFIVQASDIAAMTPNSNIGAAHPVQASGENIDGDMSKKVMNDLQAQMRSIVQMRGRNQDTALRMIDESISLTAGEALREGVIEIIAPDLNSLISALSGRYIKIGSRMQKIELDEEITITRLNMTLPEKIVQFISSPDIAYLLLSGGIMAIFLEIIIPGGFMLGTLGAIMVLLGAIGLKILPFGWAGAVLILAGALLILADIFAGTSGLLTLAGLPVIIIGGIFLFKTSDGGELLKISTSAFYGAIIGIGSCFIFLIWLALKNFRRRISTGSQGMAGLTVKTLSDVDANISGQVSCRGEIWQARSENGIIQAGSKAVVKNIDGMILIIAPCDK